MRLLWRDWRSGELLLMTVALVMSVTVVAMIAMFTDRLSKALTIESAAFLGADRVISSSDFPPDSWVRMADEEGLHHARVMRFPTMVFSSTHNRLAAVKAVTEKYPLRGTLLTATSPFLPGQPTRKIPAPGEVWLDSRLFPALGIDPGDRISIGTADFVVAGVVIREPDRRGGLFALAAPRVLMHYVDVPSTGIVQPGSRVFHDLLLGGPDDALQSYRQRLGNALTDDFRWRDIRREDSAVSEALERAEKFLLLGGLLGVILAGIAVALAARRYAERHYDHVALLKTFGLPPRGIALIYLGNLGCLGVMTTLAGLAIGTGLQYVIDRILAGLLLIVLPAPGIRPHVAAAVTGFVCLLSFAAPPLYQLKDISPLRIIRRDFKGMSQTGSGIAWLLGMSGSLLLLVWYGQSLHLSGWILLGAAVSTAVLLLLSRLLLKSGHLVGMQAGSSWRLAFSGLHRRSRGSSMQMAAFGVTLMLLVLLVLVRTGLVTEWQTQLPENSPNHFVVNIAPDQVMEVRRYLAPVAGDDNPLYPLVRGRIMRIGGEPVSDRITGEEAERHDVNDERNFSFAHLLPADNELIAGQWWSDTDTGPPQISLEESLAEALRARIGETLQVQIADQVISAEISSIRRVKWNNMRPNFYLLFSPGVLDGMPGTWMTSFYLDPDKKMFLHDFLTRFPTLTVLDVEILVNQVRRIIEQISRAIELILVLVLISGVLVLLAGIRSSMDERYREYAVLRTIGSSSRLVLSALAIEFCVLGAFSGVLAITGAEVAYYGLQSWIFGLAFIPHFVAWVIVPLMGLVLIGVPGLAVTWKVVRTPPKIALLDIEVCRGHRRAWTSGYLSGGAVSDRGCGGDRHSKFRSQGGQSFALVVPLALSGQINPQ